MPWEWPKKSQKKKTPKKINFSILQRKEKKGMQTVKVEVGHVLSKLREFALKSTPRTFTIEHFTTVTGIIGNNPQETAGNPLTKTLEPDYPNSKPSSVT